MISERKSTLILLNFAFSFGFNSRRSSRGYTIRAGSSNKESNGFIYRIQRFYRHPNYQSETLDYDFSLVKLTQPLTFSDEIKAIALPEAKTRAPERTMCTVSGWGKQFQ